MVAIKSLIPTLLAAITTVSAVPAPETYTTNNANYVWSVTNWEAGSVRSGNYYYFNITGPEYQSIPAFSAYCAGRVEGAPFYPCEINDALGGSRGVAAKLLATNETGTGAHLAVSYQYGIDGTETYYNYTGFALASYNAYVAPQESFDITPSEAYGVA